MLIKSTCLTSLSIAFALSLVGCGGGGGDVSNSVSSSSSSVTSSVSSSASSAASSVTSSVSSSASSAASSVTSSVSSSASSAASSVSSTSSSSAASSSSTSSNASLTIGGEVSGLGAGKTLKLTKSIVVSMANTEAGVSVDNASQSFQFTDNPGKEYTVGWGFTLDRSRMVTHLGVWSGGGLYDDVDLGLWDSGGNLLSSISLLNANIATYGLENDFSFAKLPTSILLAPGAYTVGGFYHGGVLASYGAPVTPINGLSYLTPSLVDFGTALAQPIENFSEPFANGYFGPNLRFLMGAASTVSEEITLSGNGSFIFPTALANGDEYAVEVTGQPDGESCSIVNSTGTMSGSGVTNVLVTCVPSQLTSVASVQSWLSSGDAVSSVVIDPSGRWKYVANYNEQTVSMYSICQITTTVCSKNALENIGVVELPRGYPLYIEADNTSVFVLTDGGDVFHYFIGTDGKLTPTLNTVALGGGVTGLIIDGSRAIFSVTTTTERFYFNYSSEGIGAPLVVNPSYF